MRSLGRDTANLIMRRTYQVSKSHFNLGGLSYLILVQLVEISLIWRDYTAFHREDDALLRGHNQRQVVILQHDVVSTLEVLVDRNVFSDLASVPIPNVKKVLLRILLGKAGDVPKLMLVLDATVLDVKSNFVETSKVSPSRGFGEDASVIDFVLLDISHLIFDSHNIVYINEAVSSNDVK